ncbi:iron ABC transporter substrate-binding protein [Natronosporangium hydrolyticum]|uniref:Iron ABC transporter substrate-binding protein n=1 Tax=Natronosporangium hydrolyticum TaxID=2811111 RepID=A0A895YIY7_9ACTN|nr:iron ABC transporter substrate-binding protein [Natronosporangium hydrolyticum]QSB15955.1 iron ABC transporter substrate-binding protein [Natronosporangium hydrolyticum]
MGGSRLRAVTTLAVAGALLLGAAACAGDDDDDSGPAEDGSTGSFTLYSGRNENLIEPLIEQFQSETGITVDVRYGDTAQMAAQLLDEGDRSPAQVFLAQDAGALGAVSKAGMFDPLPDEVLEVVPEAYQGAGGDWVGVTGRSRVLVYNQELVDESELPDSVFELTEPQWEGRVGVAPTNGSFQAFVTAMRVQHGDDATADWLAGIADNDPQIRERNGQILDDVNAGRIEVGLVNHYYLHELAKEEGVPFEEMPAQNYYFPAGDTGALMNISGIGVLAGAIEDADVRTFVDYLLSTEGQAFFTEQTSEYPMVAEVDAPAELPELAGLEAPEINLNDLDSLEETVVMITESGLA